MPKEVCINTYTYIKCYCYSCLYAFYTYTDTCIPTSYDRMYNIYFIYNTFRNPHSINFLYRSSAVNKNIKHTSNVYVRFGNLSAKN